MTEHGSMLSSPDLSEALHEAATARLTFRQVYDTYFAFVWRAAANRGVPDAAMDDVVQEVFLVVHRKLAGFEGRSTLRTWLSGIVRRVVADHVKKRGNQATAQETLDDHAVEAADDPAEDLERRAAVELVEALLEKMSDAHRDVFVLYELEQLTTREIAELTKTNENTVQTRLKAARKTFQRGLERYRAGTERRPP
ncbi:MAG TPA: sigma-70 family RNA polymerase sigma factor [Polyangiaceae bacterium]|jgi:RNA polymerase sigma-70 factor (ECF subfamily)|nr:sigma-70 family RNA polymerase sigma factor [Polyangiaceae bacterium]